MKLNRYRYRNVTIEVEAGEFFKNLDKPLAQRFQLKDYVVLLSQLPLVPPIILGTPAEQRVLSLERGLFQGASLWLRNILLGEALSPKAYEAPYLYYEPFAQLLASNFRLATAVHARTSSEKVLKFQTPAAFWFYCCWDKSQRHLEGMGLTGNAPLWGKGESYKIIQNFCSGLEDLNIDFSKFNTDKNPEALMLAEAQSISHSDSNFYIDHLLPYVKVVRRTARKEKDCNCLQLVQLMPDGELFVTGKNNKLVSARRRLTES